MDPKLWLKTQILAKIKKLQERDDLPNQGKF